MWEQAYKPGSVPGPLTLPSPPSRGARSMRSYQAATISLGRLLPGTSSSLPGDAAGRLISPYVALHRAGFAQVSGHPEPRALLPHDCTLTSWAPPPPPPPPPPGGGGIKRVPTGGVFFLDFSCGGPPLGVFTPPPLCFSAFLPRRVGLVGSGL